MKVPLARFCQARSGDKGNISDIALFAPGLEAYELIRNQVTVDRVKAHFSGWVEGPVHRFEVPGLEALKFVLEDALGGGGPSSLRTDALGKAMGSALLRLEVDVPEDKLADWARPEPPE